MTQPHSTRPEISVVVATHNRASRLAALIDSLERQTLGRNRYEVVVVDDGSTDHTAEVLARAKRDSVMRLRSVALDTARGPAFAREQGWRASSAPVIAFTDDDCETDPEWLQAGLRAAISGEHERIIQGRTEPLPAERPRLGPFTRTIEVTALDAGFQTCNIFYPRALLERIGGFDTDAFDRSPGGEDADLAWRAIKAGAEPVFEAAALVHHAVNELGPVGKLRVAARWTTPMRAYVRHPELREAHFVKRWFWKGSHYLLARALLALPLPRRLRWLTPWMVLPYLQEIELRRRRENARPWILPFYVLHDLVECGAILRAAIRYRHPMA
jgi:glycosyltransferase involved in cell wall biosynthesis